VISTEVSFICALFLPLGLLGLHVFRLILDALHFETEGVPCFAYDDICESTTLVTSSNRLCPCTLVDLVL
jgi:hypothetical protein